MTGESTPVEKSPEPTAPDMPLAERHDFVFMGTSIATGTGFGEVVATGMQTELGRIAHLLATAEDTVTPLQRRLARVSQTLLYICGAIVALVAFAGMLRGWPLMQVFMAAVSLAVAAVPEGLMRPSARSMDIRFCTESNGVSDTPRALLKVSCRSAETA